MSGSCLLVMVLTLPETARKLVADGSVNPPSFSRLPVSFLRRRQERTTATLLSRHSVEWRIPNPLKSLVLLGRRDTLCVVIAGGILYMVYCCLHASLSSLFIEIYNLNQLEAGLIYLPFGAGNTISLLFLGKIIDRDYRLVAERYGLPLEKAKGDDLSRFPIEEARTRSVFFPLGMTIAVFVGFGWTVHARVVSIQSFLQNLRDRCL